VLPRLFAFAIAHDPSENLLAQLAGMALHFSLNICGNFRSGLVDKFINSGYFLEAAGIASSVIQNPIDSFKLELILTVGFFWDNLTNLQEHRIPRDWSDIGSARRMR
jgi:hypothetical protein